MSQLHAYYGEELLRTHRSLLADLRELEQTTQQTPTAAELAKCLGQVYEHLVHHFDYEEQGGYLTSYLNLEPHLKQMTVQLHDDHRVLLSGLSLLAKQLDETTGTERVGTEQIQKIRDWMLLVRKHEQRENEWVYDAFCLDLMTD